MYTNNVRFQCDDSQSVPSNRSNGTSAFDAVKFQKSIEAFDKDRDGVLNRAELTSFIWSLNILDEDAEEEEIEELIRYFTGDAEEHDPSQLSADGNITVRGLVDFYQKVATPTQMGTSRKGNRSSGIFRGAV